MDQIGKPQRTTALSVQKQQLRQHQEVNDSKQSTEVSQSLPATPNKGK